MAKKGKRKTSTVAKKAPPIKGISAATGRPSKSEEQEKLARKYQAQAEGEGPHPSAPGGTPGLPKKSLVQFSEKTEASEPETELEGEDEDAKPKTILKPGQPGFKWSEEFSHLKDKKPMKSLEELGEEDPLAKYHLGSKKGHGAFALDEEDLEKMIIRRSQVEVRYGPSEMIARSMQAENMFARVMLDAAKRWAIVPKPGPLPEMFLKDTKDSERHRRLGRSHSIFDTVNVAPTPGEKKVKPSSTAETEGLWIGPLGGMAPSSALAAAYAVSSLKMLKETDTEETKPVPMKSRPLMGDVCIMENEPCRRFFTIKCFPCPEHIPGVQRDPRKVCICETEPRPVETFRDALRFLGMLPRELHVTYSSLDPLRIQEEEERLKSENEWRQHIAQWRTEYDIAAMQAKNLISRMQAKAARPPFVEENNSLRRLRGFGSLPLHII